MLIVAPSLSYAASPSSSSSNNPCLPGFRHYSNGDCANGPCGGDTNFSDTCNTSSSSSSSSSPSSTTTPPPVIAQATNTTKSSSPSSTTTPPPVIAQASNMTKYYDPQGRFSVSYPTNWTVTPATDRFQSTLVDFSNGLGYSR